MGMQTSKSDRQRKGVCLELTNRNGDIEKSGRHQMVLSGPYIFPMLGYGRPWSAGVIGTLPGSKVHFSLKRMIYTDLKSDVEG